MQNKMSRNTTNNLIGLIIILGIIGYFAYTCAPRRTKRPLNSDIDRDSRPDVQEELTTTNPAEVFLATMFSGAGHASQDTGMLVASSTDGVSFRNIGGSADPVYLPASGVRDPSVLYRQGQWYLVHSYGPNVLPLLFLAKSSDLLHWDPIGSLRLTADTENNYIDVP